MAEFTEVMKQRERMCKEQKPFCSKCGISYKNNTKNLMCADFTEKYPQEAEEIIMQWAKEHQIKTNADKFMEVFGTVISIDSECPFDDSKCKEADFKCNNCEYVNFWSQEYVEPKEEQVE